MTTIVVPLDGSTFSERALRPACSIAARLGHSRVVLVNCAHDDIGHARHHLDDRARLFSDVVQVETRLVDHKDPADAILSTVASEGDATLCMATHGRGGIGATVLGSVANQVVCRSTRPLVLVGPQCRTALLPAEHGRMLVCTDASPLADSVIPVAREWSDRLRVQLWLAQVVPPDENPEAAHRPARHRHVEAATSHLAELSAQLGGSAVPTRSEVLHGTPSSAIVDFAERISAALIAIATHGRSGLTRVVMGSVATDVVRHASCPVLITRPDEDRTDTEH